MSKTVADERTVEGSAGVAYVVNRHAWDRLWARTGLLTDYAIAEAMAVDQSSITRMVRSAGHESRRPTLDWAARAVLALRDRTGDPTIGLDDLIRVGGDR